MSDDLTSLYQEIILKHNKAPVGKESAPENWAKEEGRNKICGDEVRIALDVDMESGLIREARFQGASCAICTASASMMVKSLSGKSLSDAASLKDTVIAALQGGEALNEELHGELHALNGVKTFPARLRCASLPWEVLEKLHTALGSGQ